MAALRLSHLKIVALRSAATADPVQRRRRKMIAQLERQRSLVLDQDYTVPRRRWVKAVDGTAQLITAPKRVNRWWRVEPRRVCRRLISVSYAAMGSVSRAA